MIFFFFFQAEDGIRDRNVTGVQTCALPICGRRRGVEIRPGSVKEARQQAGLSLGQIAREDISRTAIYFVETGKAKPSIETLQLIADRTGHPLDFFLVGEDGGHLLPAVKLAELERLMAIND